MHHWLFSILPLSPSCRAGVTSLCQKILFHKSYVMQTSIRCLENISNVFFLQEFDCLCSLNIGHLALNKDALRDFAIYGGHV